MLILEYLCTGEENAMPASLLADLMNCDTRRIRAQVLMLRRAGYPILSIGSEGTAGYFLPDSENVEKGRAEAQRFVRSQRRRAATAHQSMIGPMEYLTRNERQLSLDCDQEGAR